MSMQTWPWRLFVVSVLCLTAFLVATLANTRSRLVILKQPVLPRDEHDVQESSYEPIQRPIGPTAEQFNITSTIVASRTTTYRPSHLPTAQRFSDPKAHLPKDDDHDYYAGVEAEVVEGPTSQQLIKRRNPVDETVFYGIDTTPVHSDLRKASRNTWLPFALARNHSYKFFMFANLSDLWHGSASADLQHEMQSYGDIVLISSPDLWFTGESVVMDKHARSGALVRALLQWFLVHRHEHILVKLDHDVFVCPQVLGSLLKALPSTRVFASSFHNQPRTWCRGDQCFQLFTRDVVERTISLLNHTPGWNPMGTWAKHNFGRIAQFWHFHGELEIFDTANISEWYWNRYVPGDVSYFAFRQACTKNLFIHLYIPGPDAAIKDPTPFYELSPGLRFNGERTQAQLVKKALARPPCLSTVTASARNCSDWALLEDRCRRKIHCWTKDCCYEKTNPMMYAMLCEKSVAR